MEKIVEEQFESALLRSSLTDEQRDQFRLAVDRLGPLQREEIMTDIAFSPHLVEAVWSVSRDKVAAAADPDADLDELVEREFETLQRAVGEIDSPLGDE